MKQSGKQQEKSTNQDYKYVVDYDLLDQNPNVDDEMNVYVKRFDASKENDYQYWSWDPRYTNLCWDADGDGYYEHILCKTEDEVKKYVSEFVERAQKQKIKIDLHFDSDINSQFVSSVKALTDKSEEVISARELPDENLDYSNNDQSKDNVSFE